jgi:hypothetical protein
VVAPFASGIRKPHRPRECNLVRAFRQLQRGVIPMGSTLDASLPRLF